MYLKNLPWSRTPVTQGWSSAAAPKREQRLTVTPSPSGADFDDDFGFNETHSFFEDAKNYNPETGQDE